MPPRTHTFWGDFRLFFLRGLAILLPSVLTIALLVWAGGFLMKNIASPINALVREGVIAVGPSVVGPANMGDWYRVPYMARAPGEPVEPGQIHPAIAEVIERGRAANATPAQLQARIEAARHAVRQEQLAEVWRTHWYLNGIGFVVAIVLVYLAGVLVGNYIGRRIYARVEGWLVRVPVIKQVYPSVKQIVDFLIGGDAGSSSMPSNRVVLVEYPRMGLWTVGLMTGETMRAVEDVAGSPCVTVFIPSSPTPFTGYTITVRRDEVHDLPISLDEAIRFCVSGGVLIPPHQSPSKGADRSGADGPDLASGADNGMMIGQASGSPGGTGAGDGQGAPSPAERGNE